MSQVEMMQLLVQTGPLAITGKLIAYDVNIFNLLRLYSVELRAGEVKEEKTTT